MLTYEDYLNKTEELTREEISNKATHTEIMRGIEDSYKKELMDLKMKMEHMKLKQSQLYQEKQQAVREAKRRLKIQFKLDNPRWNGVRLDNED